MISITDGGFPYYQFGTLKQLSCISHGISTRLGGISIGDYSSCNMALHVGDDKNGVLDNRMRFCRALEIDSTRIIVAEQVHGSQVVQVSQQDWGCGAMSINNAIAAADALLTAAFATPIMVFSADCPLLLFVAPNIPAIGVVHSSWRGTVQNIAGNMVNFFCSQFAMNSADLWVGIGPSIGPCCYEVQHDVYDVAQAAGLPRWVFEYRQQSLYFDLWKTISLQLESQGVCKSHIEHAAMCTACHGDTFYSYRLQNGKTGRFALMAQLTSENKYGK